MYFPNILGQLIPQRMGLLPKRPRTPALVERLIFSTNLLQMTSDSEVRQTEVEFSIEYGYASE